MEFEEVHGVVRGHGEVPEVSETLLLLVEQVGGRDDVRDVERVQRAQVGNVSWVDLLKSCDYRKVVFI